MLREPPYDDDRHLRPVPDDDGPERGGRAVPPADIPAEKALLAALLQAPRHAPELALELTGSDFYQPRNETIWNALQTATGDGCTDRTLVAERVAAAISHNGNARHAPYLLDLATADGDPLYLSAYTQTIRDNARLRTVATAARAVLGQAEKGDLERVDQTLAELVDITADMATRYGPATGPAAVHVPNVREFLTDQAEAYDWLIPGVLERGDRVILTGGEGAGKSTLGRQFAMMAAAGIHPFSTGKIPPIRVVIIDFENPEKMLQRKIGELYGKVAKTMDADNLLVYSQTEGIDLSTQDGRGHMTAIVRATKPDLIVTGPHYKMTSGDTDKEKDSKPIALFLDQLRAEYGCAIWLEAHVGNETQGSKIRPERPFGWSGWRRWPEFGLYLSKEGELKHWRGDRDQRNWPAHFVRGQDWPWTPVVDELESRWLEIKGARESTNLYLSYNDLVAMTDLDKATVQRTIGKGKRYCHEWTVLNGPNTYTATHAEEPW